MRGEGGGCIGLDGNLGDQNIDTALWRTGYLDWFQDNVVIRSRWEKESHCKCLEVPEGIVFILNTGHIMKIGLQFGEGWGGGTIKMCGQGV